MGDEATADARRAALAPYRLDDALLDRAAPGAIALHCLPAHPGEEITAEVLYGARQRIWDQAENRRHAQKALLEWLLATTPSGARTRRRGHRPAHRRAHLGRARRRAHGGQRGRGHRQLRAARPRGHRGRAVGGHARAAPARRRARRAGERRGAAVRRRRASTPRWPSLTLHHWSDWRAGCAELRRVARERVVVFSWDPTYVGRMWLGPEYFPELAARGRAGFPSLAEQAAALRARGRGRARAVGLPRRLLQRLLAPARGLPRPGGARGHLDARPRADRTSSPKGSRACAPTSTAARGRAATPTCSSATSSTSATACSSAADRPARHARRPGTRVRPVCPCLEGGPMPQPKSSRSSSSRPERPPSAPRASRRPRARRQPRQGRREQKPAAKRSRPRSRRAKRSHDEPAEATRATATKARRHERGRAAPTSPRCATRCARASSLTRGRPQGGDGRRGQARADHAQGRHRADQSLLAAGARRPTASAPTSSSCSAAAARGRCSPATACCARSTARAGASASAPTFPITLYDELNAAQIQSRLRDLTPASCARCATTSAQRQPQVGAGRDREASSA